MNCMTLEQLRTTSLAGGVTGVTLKGQGGGFVIEIATRSGHDAFLAKARSTEPRRFGNPASALLVVRDMGIDAIRVDVTHWDPDQKDMSRSRETRSAAMRQAHKAAAYTRQLASDLEASILDPRPILSNDEVMARMDSQIGQHKAAGAKRQ
ncbi:hypothetical protein ASC83_22650 [Acidovorax sp. Root402]|nr:hypothetical protein ASC83_22650 [Acidovorax sp. Root402]